MRPLKTKHLNNFLVKIFASWGGDGCGWENNEAIRVLMNVVYNKISLPSICVCGCVGVCVCARHAKTSRNLPVIQLAQPTPTPFPLFNTLFKHRN